MKITPYKVLRSAASYYIGRQYFDDEAGCYFPYDRESGYFKTEESAQNYLQKMEE